MGTYFEVTLCGERETYLTSVAEMVLEEIVRLETQLSFYRAESDIRDLNVRAGKQAVSIDPRLFALLEQTAKLTEETEGAFDVTVAPLIKCWGFAGGSGQLPTEKEITEARAKVGMHHVQLNREDFTVRFEGEGVLIELGAIGKGYAIACAVELLRDMEVTSGLIHGGTSTVYALGAPPDSDAWKIAIQQPFDTTEGNYLKEVYLRDKALSVSAPHGKWFEAAGRRYGHVIDPRTGYPTSHNLLAAVIMDSATESDALSTALLTLGADWLPKLSRLRPGVQAIVVSEDTEGVRLVTEM